MKQQMTLPLNRTKASIKPWFNSWVFAWENQFLIILSILFFLLTIFAFYPGEMSTDTLYQYSQALSGHFSDLHPPIMAALWRFLLSVTHCPGSLFILNNILYWFFWCLLSLMTFKNLKWKLVALSLAALPPLWSQSVVLWKDTELSIGLLGAYLFAFRIGLEKPWQKKNLAAFDYVLFSVAALLFFYCTAIRFNSLPALLPLAWYVATRKEGGKSFLPSLMRTSLIIGTSLIAVHLFVYGFLKAQKTHVEQAIKIHDIVGIFVRTGDEGLIPDYWKKMNPDLTPELLRENYDPTNLNLLWTGLFRNDLVRPTTDLSQLDELQAKWKEAIFHFPTAYFQHRWAVFNGLIRIGQTETYYPFQLAVNPNPFGLKEQGIAKLRVSLKYYFWFFGNSFLFKGWFYFLLSIGVIFLASFNRFRGTIFSEISVYSALSALFYGCAYFLCATGSDFRFLYPTVTLSVFSMAMLLSSFELGWNDRGSS